MIDSPRLGSARRCGFTLVELLVVIGIIGALIAILLPVLSSVQAKGRDIKCRSNLRQIVQAILGYAAENKGSMPYGFYLTNSYTGDGSYDNPGDWGPVGSWDQPFISWPSLVGHWMAKTPDATNVPDANFPPVLQCPEALQSFPHPLSYAMNMIVAVSPFDELRAGAPPNAQRKPPLVHQMLRDTALVWDTPVQPNWAKNLGFLLGADIDGQRFWRGATSPQFRYYSDRDPFLQFSGQIYANNKPVRLDVGNITYTNIDPPAHSHFPWQGTLRFRHQKETACNTGFADGHVEAFTGSFRRDKTLKSHTAIRRQFMIKYPTGVKPDDSFPY
jgi:prepilin-type N-terminal cleavage/methylation domain-containing protein/prepilin-type processing-associated H-X9-DG protein